MGIPVARFAAPGFAILLAAQRVGDVECGLEDAAAGAEEGELRAFGDDVA
jgi:hypothetical protein